MNWEQIIITTILCVTAFGISTQLKSCAIEEAKKTVIHVNYDCEDMPPEHKP